MNVAILIDAENMLPSHADLIFDHAASLGTVVHREIYGAASALTAWVAPVLKYAIHSNLTIKAAKGKNSSDIALVIGAMDLVAAGDTEAVIIASSDSDFSSLSVRLRNAGMQVIGMGTEKSNDLWRMACSTFVVLDPQKSQSQARSQGRSQAQQKAKPAQPAKQAAAAQPAPEQPKQNQNKPQKAATHEERSAIIRAFIEKRLESSGGRLQTGTIFTALNRLPEYRADKQGSGRKPLNYLTSTFGDAFVFEDTPDGKSWVSLPGHAIADAPAEEAPEQAAAPEAPGADSPAKPEATPDAPEAKAPAKREAVPPKAAADAPADAAPAEEAPVAPSAEDLPAALPAEGTGTPDPFALLVASGLAEDASRQIVQIFTESKDLRSAYNRLRTTFGNTTGREYYQRVKEIADAM